MPDPACQGVPVFKFQPASLVKLQEIESLGINLNSICQAMARMAPGPPLFTLRLGTDSESKPERPRWFPTTECTRKVYYLEDTRKALDGWHLVENTLWHARHLDHLMHSGRSRGV